MPTSPDFEAIYREKIVHAQMIKDGVFEELVKEGLPVIMLPGMAPNFATYGYRLDKFTEFISGDPDSLSVMQGYKLLFYVELADPDCFRKLATFVKENLVALYG